MYDSRPARRSTQQPAPRTRIVKRFPPAGPAGFRPTPPGPAGFRSPPSPGMRFQVHNPSPAHLPRATNIAPPCGHRNAGKGRVACGSGTVCPEARQGPVRTAPRSPRGHHRGRRAGSRTNRGRCPPGTSAARVTGLQARGMQMGRGREAPRRPPGSPGVGRRRRSWRWPGGSRGTETACRRLQDPAGCPRSPDRRPREGLPAGGLRTHVLRPHPPATPTGSTRQNLPPPPSPPPPSRQPPAAATAVSHSPEYTYPPHPAPPSPWYGPCYRPLVDVPLRIGRLRRGFRPGLPPPDDTLISPTYGRS
jgi:hypothetical protein